MSIERRSPSNALNPEQKRSKEITDQVLKLLHSQIPVEDIARLLDAEDCLQFIPGKRGGGDVIDFDVRTYVQRSAAEGAGLLLPVDARQLGATILPPDQGEILRGDGDDPDEMEKQIIPRSHYLAEVLTELQCPYSVISGKNASNMMRGLSYQAFFIPGREKVVFVNDESGNMTFVVHGVADVDALYALMQQTKNELRAQENVVQIRWGNDAEEWKKHIEVNLAHDGIPKKEKNQTEEAPEGWLTKYEIEKQTGVPEKMLEKYIAYTISQQPTSVKEYRGRNINRPHLHYAPEIVQWARDFASQITDLRGAGYITVGEAIGQATVTEKTYRRQIEIQRAAHTEWFRTVAVIPGDDLYFIAPELKAEVEKVFGAIEKSPEGWMTENAICQSRKITPATFARFLLDVPVTNEGQKKMYHTSMGLSEVLHYSPEYIAVFDAWFGKFTQAPEGWMQLADMVRVLGKSDGALRPIIERISQGVTGQKKEHLIASGSGIAEFYSPQLIESVQQDIEEYDALPLIPEGWLPFKKIAEATGLSTTRVQELEATIEKIYPEWVMVGKVPGKKRAKVFAPEVIQLLRERNAERINRKSPFDLSKR